MLHDPVDPTVASSSASPPKAPTSIAIIRWLAIDMVEDVASRCGLAHGEARIDVVHGGANRRQQRERIPLGAADVQSDA